MNESHAMSVGPLQAVTLLKTHGVAQVTGKLLQTFCDLFGLFQNHQMSVLSMISDTQDSIKTEGINNPGFGTLKKSHSSAFIELTALN